MQLGVLRPDDPQRKTASRCATADEIRRVLWLYSFVTWRNQKTMVALTLSSHDFARTRYGEGSYETALSIRPSNQEMEVLVTGP